MRFDHMDFHTIAGAIEKYEIDAFAIANKNTSTAKAKHISDKTLIAPGKWVSTKKWSQKLNISASNIAQMGFVSNIYQCWKNEAQTR